MKFKKKKLFGMKVKLKGKLSIKPNMLTVYRALVPQVQLGLHNLISPQSNLKFFKTICGPKIESVESVSLADTIQAGFAFLID